MQKTQNFETQTIKDSTDANVLIDDWYSRASSAILGLKCRKRLILQSSNNLMRVEGISDWIRMQTASPQTAH